MCATFVLGFWLILEKMLFGFFGGFVFHLGHQLATFRDRLAMLGEHLSQKLPLAPP